MSERYPALKAQRPSLGRRPLLLLITDEFWSLDARTWSALTSVVADNPPGPQPPWPWAHDRDEHDVREDVAAAAGSLCARTTARALMKRGQRSAPRCAMRSTSSSQTKLPLAGTADRWRRRGGGDIEMETGPQPQPPATGSSAADSDDDASTNEEDEGDSSLFAPLSDAGHASTTSRTYVRCASSSTFPPVQHQADCMDYRRRTDTRGCTLWIFDAHSRVDGCARLVSEAGDVATGDSWRARATHMAELQAGLAARALRIDFGGLDRWDYNERRRNMLEADAGACGSVLS
ncbi:hypothetical protein EDB89DRAFT_2230207 [Lactarius sanguifluus]|nr:hypothetical protein EDB89DRAFT_2230207 [Lactarius sanguifluus]